MIESAETIQSILLHDAPPKTLQSEFTVSGPVISTEKSRIYIARPRTRGKSLAIKSTSPEEAQEQFDALTMATELLKEDARFGAPAPIMLLREHGIVVMDWIEAPSFQTVCLSLGTPAIKVRTILSSCGQMLAQLHAEPHLGTNVLDTADFLNDVHLVCESDALPKSLLPAMTLLEKTAHAVHTLDLPVTILHGDFKSANVLVSSETVYTIDAAMKWEGALVHDVAHFLNQFALDLYHPAGLRLRAGLKAYENTFIGAYTDNLHSISHLALMWLRLQKFVIMSATHFTNTERGWSSRYLTLCLRSEINRMSRYLGDL